MLPFDEEKVAQIKSEIETDRKEYEQKEELKKKKKKRVRSIIFGTVALVLALVFVFTKDYTQASK